MRSFRDRYPIYNHFESKESILTAATIRVLEDFHAQVARTDDPGTDVCDRLENLVRRHLIYQLEHLQLARANDLLMGADALRYLLPDAVHAHVRELRGKPWTWSLASSTRSSEPGPAARFRRRACAPSPC